MPTTNDLFVDTSGWAYYLDRQDPLHPAFVTLAQRYLISPLVAMASRTQVAILCFSSGVVFPNS